ncbi:MAG TPA: 50S ribosomal protein L18 [Phycisphaerae bacterium]|nr:50S ribosomal protein L18 [Phycisphaerae bacterium]
MSSANSIKLERRARRKARVKGAVRGTSERPRLAVFRSLKNIYAQIIDDSTGRTLAAAGTLEKGVRGTTSGGNIKAAMLIGKQIAQRAVEKGIKQVAFDRAGYRYHGRVKALADAAREGGLSF